MTHGPINIRFPYTIYMENCTFMSCHDKRSPASGNEPYYSAATRAKLVGNIKFPVI